MQSNSVMDPLLQLTGLDKLTVQMLKRELGHRGLPAHGRKHELQRRLLRATVLAGLSEPGDIGPVGGDTDTPPGAAAAAPRRAPQACSRRRLPHPGPRRYTARSRGRLQRWAAGGGAGDTASGNDGGQHYSRSSGGGGADQHYSGSSDDDEGGQ